jgi:hypothetical protein
MAKTVKTNGRGRGRPAGPVSAVPDVETESGIAAFTRIAEHRMNGILTKLNTLAKLSSGKSKYGYTDEHVEYIRQTLIKAVNSACERLRRKPVKEGFSFEKGRDASA